MADQACASTKVCVKYLCERALLVPSPLGRPYWVCPKCGSSYRSQPHPELRDLSAPTPKQREEREPEDFDAELQALADYIDSLGLAWEQRTTLKQTMAQLLARHARRIRTHPSEEPGSSVFGHKECARCHQGFRADLRDVYRCVECSLPFHQACAKMHFRDTSHDSPEEPVGIRAPDMWAVEIEGDGEGEQFVTRAEAEAHARWLLDETDEDDPLPVEVYPVWYGDPRTSSSIGQPLDGEPTDD